MRRQLTTFHHAFTTFLPSKNHTETRSFCETPFKKLSKTTQKAFYPRPEFFLQNYGVFRIAFTAIAFGEPPAGSIVNSVGNVLPPVRITATSPE